MTAWGCPACTFNNPASRMTCEMCAGPNPNRANTSLHNPAPLAESCEDEQKRLLGTATKVKRCMLCTFPESNCKRGPNRPSATPTRSVWGNRPGVDAVAPEQSAWNNAPRLEPCEERPEPKPAQAESAAPEEPCVQESNESSEPGWLRSHSKTQVRRHAGMGGRLVTRPVDRYVREDIPCRSLLCEHCSRDPPPLLQDTASHYLVPTLDTLTHFYDLFKLGEWKNVIILESTLDQLRARRHLRDMNKLLQFSRDPKRCTAVFMNKCHIETSLEQQQWESPTDFARREVLTAADWLRRHWGDRMPVIVVDTTSTAAAELIARAPGGELLGRAAVMEQAGADPQDVLALREQARELLSAPSCADTSSELDGGLKVLDITQYVEDYWSASEPVQATFDSLWLTYEESLRRTEATAKVSTASSQWLSEAAVLKAVEEGTLIKGAMLVDRHHFSEALVRNSSAVGVKHVLLPARPNRLNAVHGDVVAVRLLPQEHWERRVLSGKGDIVSASLQVDGESSDMDAGELVPTGCVEWVLERRWRPCVATLQVDEGTTISGSTGLCLPMDRRVEKIRVRSRRLQELVNMRIVVMIDAWQLGSSNPMGHLLKILGPVGDITVETEALLVEADLASVDFTSNVLADLIEFASDDWSIPASEIEARRDLRDTHLICSIDPPGCRDVDDALHAFENEDGDYECGVHIADVTYYVKEGSNLDEEARLRGTTIYLTDRRINMLPTLLSEGLCSILEKVDRLAVSVIWTLDRKTLKVKGTPWMGRTVIRSRHQLAYAQADDILSGGPGSLIPTEAEALREPLRILMAVARKNRASRAAEGAIELAGGEVHFELDDKLQPVAIEAHEDLEVNQMIAEWMIWANSTVAASIYMKNPRSSLLRKHPMPKDPAKFDALQQLLATLGLKLDTSSDGFGKHLASLAQQVSPSDLKLVRRLAVGAMEEATYFCTGTVPDRADFRHHGLALDYYTHFTSPIRRYADILVHRELLAAEGHYTQLHLEETATHINERNGASKRVQIECTALFAGLYFKSFPQQADALVFAVRRNGLLVFVPDFNLKVPVFITEGELFDTVGEFDSERKQLRVSASSDPSLNATFTTFKKVRVEVYGRSRSVYSQPKVAARLLGALKDSHPKRDVAPTTAQQMGQAVEGLQAEKRAGTVAHKGDAASVAMFKQSSSSLYRACQAHGQRAFQLSCRGVDSEILTDESLADGILKLKL